MQEDRVQIYTSKPEWNIFESTVIRSNAILFYVAATQFKYIKIDLMWHNSK
jgi:hypothetical protein